jgi:hypothetical protein
MGRVRVKERLARLCRGRQREKRDMLFSGCTLLPFDSENSISNNKNEQGEIKICSHFEG